MRLALYQPDIPQNTGAAIRAAACFGAGLDIIEPCGFPLDGRELRRVAMDYGALAPPVAYPGWSAYLKAARETGARLILMTTLAEMAIWDYAFFESDIILMGRESAGAPDGVHCAVDARLTIPLAPAARSLNMATAAAVTLAEMRRQVGWA